MTARVERMPGVPDDYYQRILEAERSHYWYRGMEAIAAALLGERMHAGLRVLDAGCGTGGFLRFLLDEGRFSFTAGVDVAGAAIDLARERAVEADVRLAPLRELPFPDTSFDLVVSSDVLQHIDERELQESLIEIRRVLAPGGALLVRTNGSRRLRRERSDWRGWDRASLRATLSEAGFACERVTYANVVQSLVATVLGKIPHAPTHSRHGVPKAREGGLTGALGLRLLRAEAWWLGRGGSLPYGHTLFALASVLNGGGAAGPARLQSST